MNDKLKQQALFESVVTVLGVSVGILILHLKCVGAYP